MLVGAVLLGHIGVKKITLGEIILYALSIIALFFVQYKFGFGNTITMITVTVSVIICRVLIGHYGKRISRGVIILISVAAMALLFVLGPFLINPFFLYVVAFVSGALFSFVGISQDTILQEDVLKAIRGRIFATKEFILNSTLLFSALLVGFLSNILDPYAIIHVAGIVLTVVFIASLLIYRSIPHETRSKL
jgi:MFS family permease